MASALLSLGWLGEGTSVGLEMEKLRQASAMAPMQPLGNTAELKPQPRFQLTAPITPREEIQPGPAELLLNPRLTEQWPNQGSSFDGTLFGDPLLSCTKKASKCKYFA